MFVVDVNASVGRCFFFAAALLRIGFPRFVRKYVCTHVHTCIYHSGCGAARFRCEKSPGTHTTFAFEQWARADGAFTVFGWLKNSIFTYIESCLLIVYHNVVVPAIGINAICQSISLCIQSVSQSVRFVCLHQQHDALFQQNGGVFVWLSGHCRR